MSTSSSIVALDAADATDPDRVGPKAANLAALAHAGLPTPGGFCLTAAAYRAQITALELDPDGLITKVTSVYDSRQLTHAQKAILMGAAITP